MGFVLLINVEWLSLLFKVVGVIGVRMQTEILTLRFFLNTQVNKTGTKLIKQPGPALLIKSGAASKPFG